MATNKIQNRLEEMKRGLYERTDEKEKPKSTPRANFSNRKQEVVRDWREEPGNKPKRGVSFLTILLVASIIFFLGSLLVAGVFFGTGRNTISSENIDLTIKGPVSLKGGEEITLQLAIANNNTVPIESVDLIVTYPENTRSSINVTKEETRFRKNLGTIAPGEVVRETVRAIIFGEENEEKEIMVSLNYRTPNSNAIFEKNKTYRFVITSAPLVVSLALPDEVNLGQEVPLEVNLVSNATEVLEDIYVELTYPNGYVFEKATPSPFSGSTLWRIGDMAPGASETIEIFGTLEGSANQSKGFGVAAGLRDESTGLGGVVVPYGSVFETLKIAESFVTLFISVNGDTSGDVVANPGEPLRVDVTWQNRLSDPVRDAEVKVIFDGPILDQDSVTPSKGFFQSSNNTIIWRQQDEPALADVPPNGSGRVSFDFSTENTTFISNRNLMNPSLDFTVVFTGERDTDSFASSDIEVMQERSVILSSEMQLLSRAVYTSGPFKNVGPLPPRVDQPTTYTIIWTVANTSNNVRDSIVRATIPTYVRWLGVISSVGEDVTYNAATGQVTWDMGRVEAGVGGVKPVREVAFQVELEPGIGQLGTSPQLMSQSQLSGRDEFTGSSLTDTAQPLTTALRQDPGTVPTDWKVVE